jgi:hypothetical protein
MIASARRAAQPVVHTLEEAKEFGEEHDYKASSVPPSRWAAPARRRLQQGGIRERGAWGLG